jgi:nuclear pore complex protein Nup107
MESNFKSDFILSQEIIEQSCSLQELLILRQWLEQTAPQFIECDIQHGFLQHTREYIMRKQNTYGMGGKSSMVTELDPDASSRQKKSLAPEDVVMLIVYVEF